MVTSCRRTDDLGHQPAQHPAEHKKISNVPEQFKLLKLTFGELAAIVLVCSRPKDTLLAVKNLAGH